MTNQDKEFLISHFEGLDTRQINDSSRFVSDGFPFYSNIPVSSRIIPHSLSRPYTEDPDYDFEKQYIVMYRFTYYNIMPIEVRNAMMYYHTYRGYYPMQVDHVQTIFDYLLENNVVGRERVRVEVENYLIEVPVAQFETHTIVPQPLLGEIDRALSIFATKNLNISAYGEEATDVIMRHFREIGSEGLIRITYQPRGYSRPSRNARNARNRSRRSHTFNTLGRRSTGRHLTTSRRLQQIQHQIATLNQSISADDRNREWLSVTALNASNGLR
jgi:hypothetical protein